MIISIIIPSYNSLSTLPILLKNLPEDKDILEILLVDSSDSFTIEKIRIITKTNKKIRIIPQENKTYPALARNIGAKEAKGELLVFIDSDAYPSDNWLQSIKESYIHGHLVGGGSIALPPFQIRKKIETAQYYLQFNEFLPSAKKEERSFIPSCNLFCQKALFHEIGGFPNIRASEDVLFGLEVSKKTRIIYLPECMVFHVFGDSWNRLRSNQKLLGKYISIYRRQLHKGIFYSMPVQYLLSPLFFLIKLSLLTLRILKTNKMHRRHFFMTFPQIVSGVFYWTIGYIQGIGVPSKLKQTGTINV